MYQKLHNSHRKIEFVRFSDKLNPLRHGSFKIHTKPTGVMRELFIQGKNTFLKHRDHLILYFPVKVSSVSSK